MHVVITECQGVFIITHTQDTLGNLHGTPKVLSQVSGQDAENCMSIMTQWIVLNDIKIKL